ncbi:hypothetical protein [Xanthomarina spongicola]|uniref:Uncharacterized protein n=1 Tax=Xanthomarina spongicola TaxID=570520 RepID=A0A316DML5_9FLAO|nr:hypothetical protein [Xanthomarina spongicola]PWK19291.1 hypothetical protein LX78_01772 [Xanthomarina spongicola]
MKPLINLLFLFCFANISLAQTMTSTLSTTGSQSWATRPVTTADMFPDEVFQKSIFNKYEGTKYLYDTWEMPARIVTTSDRELRLNNINFNIKDNRFETETLGDSLFIFNSDKIQFVETLEATYIKLKIPNSNKIGFFEKLLDLKHITLYKHPELIITEGTLNPLTQIKSPDVYTRSDAYFYMKSKSSLNEIKLKKKSILRAFSNKEKEISSFVKENKLGYTTEEDLIKILTYYDSL